MACPSCLGRIFVGAKFCSHCGARAARTELLDAETCLCPRCQADMKAVVLGGNNLRECPQCEGIWSDADTLQQICTEREKQAAVLGMPAPSPEPAGLEKNIRYLPCPVCHKLMNRVNFAHSSHVILNVCKPHGTWFEKDQLRRTVEFIRTGGLEKARAHQIAEMEEERRRLQAARNAGISFDPDLSNGKHRDEQGGLLTSLLQSLFE